MFAVAHTLYLVLMLSVPVPALLSLFAKFGTKTKTSEEILYLALALVRGEQMQSCVNDARNLNDHDQRSLNSNKKLFAHA
ncbi:hypothetical protein H4Q26_006911 [Puccinia striiformis f. sp. tritici PST-130]|nr:hypothetical protein H4Q26_006911 [Puccinia striiformis f. sp. tritici PST-130]